jgi:uncharacterized protein
MAEEHTHKHTNRLINETSPYLLQHAHNPVDWHPWGEEAFEKARRENKPLLVSIGYSACHWCHVMERESFENEQIAAIVNETCVPVKVDREERPDVDAIYMNACVMMTGQGGWPLNAFVTPDLKPFFVGTYFPPDARYGRPGFAELMQRIREAWSLEGDQLAKQAATLHEHLSDANDTGGRGAIDQDILDRAVREATAHFDIKNGGFGNAPKFPPDQRLALLLAAHHDLKSEAALSMATKTLDAMAQGGMYDQLGGGFARYSVDEHWLIPHFEKMLYNQALLVPVYLDAFLITGKPLYKRVAAETLEWVLRDMRAPEGMFCSALDADSEGEEGKYYVWKIDEIDSILSREEAPLFIQYYNLTGRGNFEHGTNNPHVPVSAEEFAKKRGQTEEQFLAELEPIKQKVLAVRAKRIPPGTDDKCLTSWNGLMITAFCRAYQVLGEERYLQAAKTAADFVLERQRTDGGSALLRVFCKGQSRVAGVLDDYAFFINALVDVYESTGHVSYLREASKLAATMIARFADSSNGGFYFTSGEDTSLITRTKELHDGALPAGSSVAAMALLRLATFFDNAEFRKAGEDAIAAAGPTANRAPSAFSSLILANRFAQPSTPQIVFSGAKDGDGAELRNAAMQTYLPARAFAYARAEDVDQLPLTKGKAGDKAAVYVCRNYACQAPVHSAEELRAQLQTT